MAQGGLVVMAGMVALVITQSDKGGHQGKGLASMRWHHVVIVNGWQGLGIMPAWFTCCLSVWVRELPIKKGMIKTIIPS